MTRQGRASWARPALLLVLCLAGVGAMGLGALLLLGWERADQLGGVIGGAVGIAGLAVAITSAWQIRARGANGGRAEPGPTRRPDPEEPGTAGDQSVTNSLIGQDNIQIGKVGGDARIDRS